jgi:Zn-dependent peptidase ImmA (M78 family)
MTQQKVINPAMIILGRESRGISQVNLARALGVTQGYVSKLEMGLLTTSEDMLTIISQLLNYPEPFFYQEDPLMGMSITEILLHRKRRDTPRKVLSRVYAQTEIRYRHIRRLLLATDIECTIPRLPIEDYEENAEKIAQLVRAQWHLPRGPIHELTKTVEDAGLIIVPFNFQTPLVDAMSRWLPACNPVFFVNNDLPKDQYRFILARELGHLVMHEKPHPELEDQAERFAMEFLLPEREVRGQLEDLDIAKLMMLKRYWKVSIALLLQRARELGTVTDRQYYYLWSLMTQARYKKREPAELDVQGEIPTLLDEIIEMHRTQLNYSISDLRTLLMLNEQELRAEYLQGHERLSIVD